jgi:hypothetical protein
MRAIGVVRLALVLIAGISWFAIANHCALAVAVARMQKQPHDCCEKDKAGDKTPAKESQQGRGECCKTLHVTLVPVAKKLVDSSCRPVLQPDLVAALVFPDPAQSMRSATELDTGPPCASSFAEMVLQRSILAHAPPYLV